MSEFYTDGNFDIASACGPLRKVYPFEGDAVSYYAEQDFIQRMSKFVPLALNTLYPLTRNIYLVGESPVAHLGGGIGRWTRTYAPVPLFRDEYETYTYEFPGYLYGYTSAGNTEGRNPQTLVVPSRIRYDYYLVKSPSQYLSERYLPTIRTQLYYGVGGPSFPVNILGDISTPTKDTYINFVKAGVEIVVEDSSYKRWMGNIFERVTRTVTAR